MANLYTWSNVVHKCVGALKVDWIVHCAYNTSLNAFVSIKCAIGRKGEQGIQHDSVSNNRQHLQYYDNYNNVL